MMKNFREKLQNLWKNTDISEKILLLAPIAIWFSYQPNIHIGRSDGMNLEFSITMIYIVILALISMPKIYKNRNNLLKNKAVWLVFGFILWNLVSILWASNKSRAVLTSGVLGVLFIDFLAILSFNLKKLSPYLIKIYIGSAVMMSIFALAQVIYGTWTDFGLCRGCIAQGFGFVRPSGFAIEPQFMGSLLIVPIIILFSRFVKKKSTKFDFLNLFLILVAMYLTLSRGAIFALVIALILLVFFITKNFKQAMIFNVAFLMNILLSSFLTGMIVHGVFTQLNPRVTDGFYDSISKSVNQMTLGRVSLPEIEDGQQEQSTSETNQETKDTIPEKASFDGYVEKSTDERTGLSDLAIKTWQKDPQTILFGVGIGGSGKAIFDYTKETASEYEIVQNQYLETLLENGIIGAVMFGLILIGFFIKTRHQKIAWAVLIAFIIQWNFFSGLPNALHIYLILATAFGIIVRAYEKRPSIN